MTEGDVATVVEAVESTTSEELKERVDGVDHLERERMEVLSMDGDAFVVSGMPPQPANYEEIIATNLGQQSPDDEEAFALELGPNSCAASDEALANRHE